MTRDVTNSLEKVFLVTYIRYIELRWKRPTAYKKYINWGSNYWNQFFSSFFTQSIFKENLNKYHRAGNTSFHIVPSVCLYLLQAIAVNIHRSFVVLLLRLSAYFIRSPYFVFPLFSSWNLFRKKNNKKKYYLLMVGGLVGGTMR